jgi:membrane-bound serine protease (ClpP class)
MCHFILLLPVVTLPVFWLWPIALAVPAYAAVLLLSAWVYVYSVRAMQRPVVTGAEQMLHTKGRVVEVDGSTARIRVRSELWDASSPDSLHKGDWVTVEEIDGLTLRVRRAGPG